MTGVAESGVEDLSLGMHLLWKQLRPVNKHCQHGTLLI